MDSFNISWNIVSYLLFIGIYIQVAQADLVGRSLGEEPIKVELPPSSVASVVYENGEVLKSPSSPNPNKLLLDDEVGEGAGVDGSEDIIDPKFERNPLEAAEKGEGSRRKRKLEGDKWPNGIVPYEFNSGRPHTEPYKRIIREAMRWWMAATCIRFVERSSDPVVLSINNIPGCSSYVGYQPNIMNSGGKQTVKLGQSTCFSTTGTVAHELGHALGLIHEQSRPDRDDHINIHVDKINSGSIHNFQTYYDAKIPEGVRYDLNSIMHYSPKSFALYLNKPTITAKNPKKDVLLGQRAALSFYDIMAINKEYCEGNCVNHCLNEGYTIFKDGRCRCVCPEGLTGSRCERVDSSCGGEISLSSHGQSTIRTTNYPNRYPNEKCIWLITAPPEYLVQVTFDDFDVASSGVICAHQVELRNNVLGQRGDILCGNGVLGPFDTRMDHKSNQMLIVFDSRNTSAAVRKGFTATLKAFKDGCLSSPCENGGTCISSGPSAYTCICEVGYVGSRCEKAEDAAVNCDFANDMCMFKNSADDQLDMRRMFISTKYMETIQRDHNSNRFFIAAPAEFETGLSDEARLVSPVFNSAKIQKRCLKFAYHMSGSYQARGQLAVSIMNAQGGSVKNLFEKHGDQRAGWKNAQIEIEHSVDYQVLFVIRTSDIYRYNSLIAIDDISIEPHACSRGACSNNPCSAYGGVCVEPRTGGHYCLCPQGRTGSQCSNYDINGFTCEFEANNHCGWKNTHSANYDWSEHYGAADGLRRTGPLSGADGSGFYMLADSSSSQAGVGRTAKLISPTINTNGDICLEFYYHMWGPLVGSLRVKTKSRGEESSSHHTITGSQSSSISEWKVAMVTLRATTDTQIILEAVSGQRHQSDIAIDKVTINKGRCNVRHHPVPAVPSTTTRAIPRPTAAATTTPSPPRNNGRRIPAPLSVRLASRLSETTTKSPRTANSFTLDRKIGQSGTVLAQCGFETGECPGDFINLPNEHNKQWLRTNTRTPSGNTGPNSAFEGRYYLYVEASDRLVDEVNVLTTHLIYNSDKKACVTFHYSMYGSGTGSLAVEMKKEEGTAREVWRMSGDKGPGWKKAEIDIDMGNEFHQIMFKTRRGRNYQGDIAVDDIKILRNECRNQNSPASSDGINIFCDFEGGYVCPGFKQIVTDDFDWEVKSGQTPTAGTGPDSAVSGTHYLVIEASSRRASARAVLESINVPANSGNVCLKLLYHMKGFGIGMLNIYQKHQNSRRVVLFTRSTEQSNEWKPMQHQLLNNPAPYTIEIEARLTNSSLRYAGDIALDDISLTSGIC